MEREGLEPDEGVMRISNLLTPLEFLSPPLPSNTRIWHRIWHWLQSLQAATYVSRHITIPTTGRQSNVDEPEVSRSALADVTPVRDPSARVPQS
jgi:hypothetical protein